MHCDMLKIQDNGAIVEKLSPVSNLGIMHSLLYNLSKWLQQIRVIRDHLKFEMLDINNCF